jgi:hypothetical protein
MLSALTTTQGAAGSCLNVHKHKSSHTVVHLSGRIAAVVTCCTGAAKHCYGTCGCDPCILVYWHCCMRGGSSGGHCTSGAEHQTTLQRPGGTSCPVVMCYTIGWLTHPPAVTCSPVSCMGNTHLMLTYRGQLTCLDFVSAAWRSCCHSDQHKMSTLQRALLHGMQHALGVHVSQSSSPARTIKQPLILRLP